MNLTGQKAGPKPQKLIPNKGLRKYVDSKPCVVCNRMGWSQNPITHHHLKTVGSGGHDESNMIPVHWKGCHAYAHSMTVKALSNELQIDLWEYAKQLTDEYDYPNLQKGRK